MFVRKYFPFSVRHKRNLLFATLVSAILVFIFYYHSGEKKSSFSGSEDALIASQQGNIPFKKPVTFSSFKQPEKDSIHTPVRGDHNEPELAEVVELPTVDTVPETELRKFPNELPRQLYRGIQPLEPAGAAPLKGHGVRRPIYPSQDHFNMENAPQVNREMSNETDLPPFVPDRRVVHLDLKGAPPTVAYLEKLVPILAKLGATGLLIEYEDMFPFDGVLKPIAARNHYTRKEVESILSSAAAHDLEVIPLVQTFGHMEFVLKLEQFSQLRESADNPESICPSRNESFNLIQLVIDQVMKMHPKSKYIHIGCDEVYHIGECSLCSSKTTEELFLGHVTRVASYVRNEYKVTPLIWDDMLRNFTPESLRESSIGTLVEPVVWVYAENVYRFVGPHIFDRFADIFPAVWGSSAFKGAFGETLVAPNVKRHLENNQNWLTVARNEGKKFREGFRGLMITGWQRYDHFSVLCELLPAALPSLALNLVATSNGYLNNSLSSLLYETLSCSRSPKYERMPDLYYDPYLHDKMSWCFFPGSTFFKMIGRFLRVEEMIEKYVRQMTVGKGWLTEYNVDRNFSSPFRLDELTRDLAYMKGSVNTLIQQTMETLKGIYDVFTISEWMELKLLPLLRKLKKIQRDVDSLRRRKTWPQRPFKLFEKWSDYDIRLDDEFGPPSLRDEKHSTS